MNYQSPFYGILQLLSWMAQSASSQLVKGWDSGILKDKVQTEPSSNLMDVNQLQENYENLAISRT